MNLIVHVVGGDRAVKDMFLKEGWIVDASPKIEVKYIDLVCFTGGADVSPALYHEKNVSSYIDAKRDMEEVAVFNKIVGRKPMVGICRGGQLLNVLSGGKMRQHINGHQSGHQFVYGQSKADVSYCIGQLHEDHHQGMLEGDGAKTIGVARDGTLEILYYKQTDSLCFQPHPEWGHDETKEVFFELLYEYSMKGIK